MRNGYVFSLLIAVLLGLFMLVSQYYLLERPSTEIYPGLVAARENIAYSIASDLEDELPITVTRDNYTIIVENIPQVDTETELLRWSNLLTAYENITKHNASLELTNYTKLSSKLWLAGNGVEYAREGGVFTLNHSGSYLLVNNTIANVANTNCDFDASGTVYTRVIVDNFDSDSGNNNYTSPGSSYNCFINFTNTTNMTITIDSQSQMEINYSNAPVNFTQRVSFEGPDKMYVVFDKYNVTTGVNPGWTESFAGNKKYVAAAGMNFVLADIDTDGDYDYAFVDVDGDGFFVSESDRWYVKEGIVALNEKVFYMRFDLAGNWILLYNALGTNSLSSWKGVAV